MGARQARYEQGRRDRGLCGWGGCAEKAPRSYYCPEHADHRNATKRDRRAAKKAQQPERQAA